MPRHPLVDLVNLAAAGRTPPSLEELEALGLGEDQVESVLAAAKHAADLYAAGAHGAARSVGATIEQWLPGDLTTLGAPPPADPLANETDPRKLAAAVDRGPW